MIHPLELVFAQRPQWARFVLSPARHALWFNTEPPSLDGLEPGLTHLSVAADGPEVSVAERSESRRFPIYCPERHLPGSEFCLSHVARPIVTSQQASEWWRDVQYFLTLQAIAEQTGNWPVMHALSHGPNAARFELDARSIVERMNLSDDYDRMLDGEPNWLANLIEDPRPVLRLPCPARVQDLVYLERKRRAAVEDYWQKQYKIGMRCCGTMKSCRLAEIEVEAKNIGAKRDAPESENSAPKKLRPLATRQSNTHIF